MGYVVDDAVKRARVRYGTFQATDWGRFIAVAGLDVIEFDLPPTIPALICDSTIVIRRDLPCWARARPIWHEIGHWWLHDGERDWWTALPQGDLTVSRFERQARDFARQFPLWEPE